jgi:hypothetical protein
MSTTKSISNENGVIRHNFSLTLVLPVNLIAIGSGYYVTNPANISTH